MKRIFSIKKQVFNLIANEDSDSDIDAGDEKKNFHRFLSIRNQTFIRRMSEYVNLHRIVSFLEE